GGGRSLAVAVAGVIKKHEGGVVIRGGVYAIAPEQCQRGVSAEEYPERTGHLGGADGRAGGHVPRKLFSAGCGVREFHGVGRNERPVFLAVGARVVYHAMLEKV